MELFDTFLWLLGAAALLRIIVKMLKSVYRSVKPGIDVRRFGKWGVVTGCTSGIGKAFAEQLARKGINVILVARKADVLNAMAKSIESEWNVQTKVVICDLGKATDDDYQTAVREIKSASDDIGILINNAGLSYDYPDDFADVDIKTHRDIIAVNNRSMVEFTHALLPVMTAKKKGLIMNIGSLAGLCPTPLMATYSASKAFVDYFSTCLAKEYKAQGIVVQNCTPGFVVSNMSKIRKSSYMVPDATAFAKSALGAVGSQPVRSLPWLPHRIQGCFMRNGPKHPVQNYIYNMHKDIRKRALRKKEREAAQGK